MQHNTTTQVCSFVLFHVLSAILFQGYKCEFNGTSPDCYPERQGLSLPCLLFKQLLGQQQEELKNKVKEHEERSRQLEKDLQEISRKQLVIKQKRSTSTASQPREEQTSRRDKVREERPTDSSVELDEPESLHDKKRSWKDATHEHMRGKRPDSRTGKSARARSEQDVYHLSKPRIDLLESEKSALMELNSSLQQENRTLKQLAVSLQKGSGEDGRVKCSVMRCKESGQLKGPSLFLVCVYIWGRD